MEDKIEEVVERKVEERMDEKREEIEKNVEKRLRKKFSEERESSENSISRREFLKKAGLGAAGIGAMGLSSASGLKLTQSGIFSSGSRTGVLTDSGSDTNGGDDYQLPGSADSIVGQDGGSLKGWSSVKTDRMEISEVPTGNGEKSNYQIHRSAGNSTDAADHIEATTVGSSETAIATRSAGSGRTGDLTLVVGEGSSGEGFTALVHWTDRGSDYTVLSDIDINSGPSSRTFSTSNYEPLKLSMASGTYEVYTRTLELTHTPF